VRPPRRWRAWRDGGGEAEVGRGETSADKGRERAEHGQTTAKARRESQRAAAGGITARVPAGTASSSLLFDMMLLLLLLLRKRSLSEFTECSGSLVPERRPLLIRCLSKGGTKNNQIETSKMD
jgi:hypothetical protein